MKCRNIAEYIEQHLVSDDHIMFEVEDFLQEAIGETKVSILMKMEVDLKRLFMSYFLDKQPTFTTRAPLIEYYFVSEKIISIRFSKNIKRYVEQNPTWLSDQLENAPTVIILERRKKWNLDKLLKKSEKKKG